MKENILHMSWTLASHRENNPLIVGIYVIGIDQSSGCFGGPVSGPP